jgi:hypothetical protein
MNWLFEAYSNVFNTAMGQGQRPSHHQPRNLMAGQKQRLRRANGKHDV